MKAIVLARVSTEEQREAGNSLPAQQARLISYIEKSFSKTNNQKLVLEKEFVFDESAYKEHRKEFNKITEYIEGFKETVALCCDKVDRLSRDFLIGLPVLERLRRDGKIELHFPSDNLVLHQNSPATDLFHYNIALALAQYYSNAISDNTKRALEQKRRNGEWTGKVRIGYLNVSLDAEKRLRKDIIIDPFRGPLIQKLFELYATGNHSLESVRSEIIKLGLRSLDENKPSKSNIDLILNDPFYCGIAVSKKYGKFAHRYPKLISKELFDRCQEVRTKRTNNRNKVVSKDFIFKGMLKCANCGCSMSAETKVKPSGKSYTYYSCTNAKKTCKKQYVTEQDLLKPIWDVLGRFGTISEQVQADLVSELRKTTEAEIEFHKAQLNRIRNEYEELKKKDDRLLDAYLDQSITKDVYDKKHQDYADKLQLLEIELSEYRKADYDYQTTVATVISLARRAQAIFDGCSEVAEKRAFLNLILQNPTVNGKKLDFTLASPFNLVLDLADVSSGSAGRIRTYDQSVNSRLLYR